MTKDLVQKMKEWHVTIDTGAGMVSEKCRMQDALYLIMPCKPSEVIDAVIWLFPRQVTVEEQDAVYRLSRAGAYLYKDGR